MKTIYVFRSNDRSGGNRISLTKKILIYIFKRNEKFSLGLLMMNKCVPSRFEVRQRFNQINFDEDQHVLDFFTEEDIK